MLQEEKAKMELPPGWKKINFYSLNLAYCFFVLFASLQVPTVRRILIKGFTEQVYDVVNGWALILLLITAAGAGILGFIRMKGVKKIINVLEEGNDDKGPG